MALGFDGKRAWWWRSSAANWQRNARVRSLLLACMCAVLAAVVTPVCVAITFSLTNAQQPSLYQTIQLTLESNPLAQDPIITTSDLVFFVTSTETGKCVYDSTPTETTPGYHAVTPTGSGGFTGQLMVAVTSMEFTTETAYYPCYLSKSAKSATIVRRGYVPPGSADTLVVWPPIYTSFSMSPTNANGGEGPASLSIVQAEHIDRPINQGLSGGYTILLVPCGSIPVSGSSVESNCDDLNALVTPCAKIGLASTIPAGVVPLSSLQGASTDKVTGNFVVPYNPNTKGYYTCVPYCYSAAGDCGESTAGMSFTVVASASSTNSSYVLTFGSANPGVYKRTPGLPQAREQGIMYFTGTGLSKSDTIKVIRAKDICTSPTAALLTNLNVGPLEVTPETEGTVTAQALFVAPDLVKVQVVGRVCYRRAASGLWSSAYLSASSDVADFTIDILQPTGFEMTNTKPTVGETLTLTFQGSGLYGSIDKAYLSSSSASNPCDRTKSESTLSSVRTKSKASNNNMYFACKMSGDSTTASTCTVLVDPEDTNAAMILSVCYLKGGSSGQTNFAQINGTVTLQARNPTYAVTPYPMFAGQSVKLTFTGVDLHADDEVQLISPTGTCGDTSSILTTVTIHSVEEVIPNTVYQYTLVGAAETCILVCYRHLGSDMWVVARGADGRPAVSSDCAASSIYISAFPVRYRITNLAAPGDNSPTVGTLLTVGETATVRFTTASGQKFSSTTTPTDIKVVQAVNTCVTAPCGTENSAACAKTQITTDYASAVTKISSTAFSASIQVNREDVNYIVCVKTSSSSEAYVAVLPTSEISATSTAFSFITAQQNPRLLSNSPKTWRVAMNTLGTTFSGSSLDANTNVVYAVASSALLAFQASEGTVVAVCPPVPQTPETVLASAMVIESSTSTTTVATYTRADRLRDGQYVYLCYAWSADGTDSHITMAGRVLVSAAIPSSFLWKVPTETSSLRAGQPFQLSFSSNVTSLSATNDAVYFYSYLQSSSPNPNCYCDPTACSTGKRITYGSDITFTSATTNATDDTTIYTAPLGFSNYDYSAIYIICYTASGQIADTYVGRVTVDMANPTYYTVSSVAEPENRVGAPISIKVTRRCVTAACALTLQDSLRLIPSAVQCSNLSVGSSSDSKPPVEEASVQAIGDPVLGPGAVSLSRTFVVDDEGTYRVCYRLASGTTYSDIVFSISYTRSLLTVVTANPQQATPVPSAPSAGQFVIMNLTCSTTSLCSTCTMLRLVPGVRASCWTDVPGTYQSDSCLTTTSVQYPDLYFVEGSYTVCYGSSYTTSRRIPGTFTVASANPSSYTPTDASGYAVYTNQITDYTLDITGTGLSTTDTVFLLTDKGYSCHDLRTGVVQDQGNLSSLLLPSVKPYPLQLTSTGVSWVVSNHAKRFGGGLLTDTDLCPGNNEPCLLKLCYMRSGTSWAPVKLASSSSSPTPTPSGIELWASNPSSVEFDRYPLVMGMYVMATVQGSQLLIEDAVTINAGNCNGASVTVSVTGAVYVDPTEQKWYGVLRVTGAASSYAVCYWHAGSPTEVASITFAGETNVSTILILRTPLYYVLSPLNFTSMNTPLTMYEELIVGASFVNQGTLSAALTYVQLITADTSVSECNYGPFQSVATGSKPFPVVLTLSAVPGSDTADSLSLYQGRLNVAAGAYAMCMNTTNGLFRVVNAPPSAAYIEADSNEVLVYDPVPITYTAAPPKVMLGQVVTLTFSSTPATSSKDGTDPPPVKLEAGDVAQIVDGTLFECGFPNATVLAAGKVSASETSVGSTTVSLTLPITYEWGSGGVLAAGKNFTVCYQKQKSTFATSPRIRSAADRNLHITPVVPTKWTAQPQQAQVNAPLSITFYGNIEEEDLLSAADVAFLVSVPKGTEPTLSLCQAASGPLSGARESQIVVTEGTMSMLDKVNTLWSIPAKVLPEDTYVVCYKSKKNGQPVYVSSPATLVVYPTQSPSGAYLARDATSIVNNLNVLQGERVFLLFNTTVPLDVVLDNNQGSSSNSVSSLKTYDEVRITGTSSCSTPLGAGVVDSIPVDFGYAPLGVVDTATGLPVPYLNLRIRADVGNYYVCMRRRNRESWEAYYEFEVVGGLQVLPAVLKISAAAVLAFTAVPTIPRVWVPHTEVEVSYSAGFSMENVEKFFFVAYTGTGSVTDSDEINGDSCYRPASLSEAASASVTLVNSTLQVYRVNPMFTQYSFGTPGTYLLCYQITGSNIASVYPTALTVANPSPTAYIVPTLLAVQHAFTMSIVAMDAIFVAGASHVAQIYTTPDPTLIPNCTEGTVPTGGNVHFTSFIATNASYASVEPTLVTPGYYFLCFLTSSQKQYFVVPNKAGGYVFSVGLVGAQKYTVTPSPAFLGQLVDVTITGSELSSKDHVKVVRVTPDEASYETQCNPTAKNADASESAGAVGSTVQSLSGTVAHYYPRVNETGTFILCYQSAALSNTWVWVTDIHDFTVGAAHPTHYSLSVDTPYETQVLQLFIHDSGDDGTGKEGRLQDTDQLKLVARGSGPMGFDCTADATTSSAIGTITYLSAQSNSSTHVYQICSATVVSVTVCYALSGATAVSPSWAEVPFKSPPTTYVFMGVSLEADPFVGPLRGLSSNPSGADTVWVAPRPYEPFSFYFTTAVAGVEVQRVAFAQSPVTRCALDVKYVTPLLYQKEPQQTNTFTVSLPSSGSYTLYIGPYTSVTAPNITHGTPLVVGQCDPCNFTPRYALAGTEVLLSFPSSTGGTLSNKDELRLFPVSQGLAGRPCEATTGAYAGVTLNPDASLSTSSITVFKVTTGGETDPTKYLGEYYVCYRLMKAPSATTGSLAPTFAVVAENNGTASIFSVYPADLLTAKGCPASQMYALETAVFNVTARDTVLYPNVAFTPSDVFIVVPSDVLSSTVGGGCGSITDVDAIIAASGGRAQLAKLDTYGNGYSNWYLTFAPQVTTVKYSWCFKMQYDTIFRNISASLQTVHMENPNAIITSPPVILPTSTPVNIYIKGSGMLVTDNVYIVPATELCTETCNRPLTPSEWPDVAHTTQYVNSTTMLVTFAQPINVVVSLGVCYRRTGRYLTRLANIAVLEPNPTSYTVNFVPRVGTRPTLTFTGEKLTGTDTMMIVKPGGPCLEEGAVATGTFVSVSEDAKTSQFLLTLVGSAVLAKSYTVCYKISTVGAYVDVSPVLQVLEGGPSSVLSSNTPMRGRATVLTVADPQLDDEMYIACVGCSCFDEVEAAVPYGSAHAKAHPVEGSTSNAVGTVSISLRVGFDDSRSYPVCYRRNGSGYAQVGGPDYFVTPVPNSPSAVAGLPASAQYQGQRLHYSFSEYTTAVPLSSGDLVMLVEAGRTCWDNVEMEPSLIVVQTSQLTSTVESLGIGKWDAHVPSLGPNVPPSTPPLFPLSYILCYRQFGQLEYVSVPFEMQATVMKAADPATFETQPTVVEKGMLEVSVTFSYTDAGKDGDAAYVVQFTDLTDTVCDDATSTIVSPLGKAYPTYLMNMSGGAIAGSSSTAVCYTRANATVAEVPQLLTVAESNPSGYITNVTPESVARERQYIELAITGSGLSVESDTVAFTDVPCAIAPRPFQSSSYLARLGDASYDGTAYKVVTQFISLTSPITIYVCYQHNSVWREVGSALKLDAPQPLTVSVTSANGAMATPRAGQHLHLQLVDGRVTAPIAAAVLSAKTTGEGTWCHNYTAAHVQEPALTIVSAAILDVSVWQVSGDARLCIQYDDGTPWADVASSIDAPSISIGPANPSVMDVFPSPPRVGQSVTLTFHLLVSSNAGDMVKITAPDYVACETAESIVGFPATMPVTVKDAATTTITLVDSTDPLLYRSFNATGAYRVCYYSAEEMSWGVVGGTLAAGSVTVETLVPQSWDIAAGDSTVGQEFALAFHDELSLLKPSSGDDLVWAAPPSVSCGEDPYMCKGCIIFEWNTSESTPTTAVTAANASVHVGGMNLCYRLAAATAALVPGSLDITTGPIQCVEEDSFISGQQTPITFRLEEGTSVTDDSWRLSFYATTSLHCNDRYLESFVPGSARLQEVTSTSATYLVVWPPGLGITSKEYTICYTHNKLIGPVCTCGQIDAKNGECYITGSPGSPQSFEPSPHPTYVGQTMTLNFVVNASMTAYPPTAIKFVTYVDELTSCEGTPAFTPVGATLTKVSELLYTYVFKHNYALGPSTLVVCALTDLSTSYSRVASVVVPSSPTTNNTLWIRPYLGLTTFPSEAKFLLSMQTLNLTFMMASQNEDDVVSTNDLITVVPHPDDCTESYISTQDAPTLLNMFYLPDTAFLTLPATVLSVNASLFLTRSLVTFAAGTAGQGTHTFCYKLNKGTWAPVLPTLTIGEALISSCSITGALSPSNGDNGGSSGATTNNGGSLRAMFYAPTQILGTALFEELASPLTDAVRVVLQSEWCTNDAAAVFTIDVAPRPSSGGGSGGVQAVFFAPLPGAYKVCYRFGTSTNWSPGCTNLAVTDPTPIGETTGCWNIGQTVDMKTTHVISGYTFTTSDRLRLVQGSVPCLLSDGSSTTSSSTVTVGDATQPAYGILLSDVVAGQTTYVMPPAFFRTNTNNVRLCYTDAAGNQFAVPLDFVGNPGKSLFPVQARQPTSVLFSQKRIQVGQRLFMNFTSAMASVTPLLRPFAALPAPYTPGPAFNGTFDGATLLSVPSSTAYTDGRCAAALRTGALATTSFLGVYGSVAQSGEGYVPYTIGNYDPTVAQHYVVCYQLATCGVVDSGDPLQVYNMNPSDVYTDVSAPRRGQLITVLFVRDTSSPSAALLTPGSDRGIKQSNLDSCWTLTDTDGQRVEGTSELTYFTTIFYAQAPELASTTVTRSCYKLSEGGWSEVPNGVGNVLAANPKNFATTPISARVNQVNYIHFYGTGLGSNDRVKLIVGSSSCSEDSVPPSSLAAYSPTAPNSATAGTSAGWKVTEVSSDGSTATLNFTSSSTGTLSVCYRLETDTVWTLVYGNLTIYERDPPTVRSTPVATLEGELFTLDFTASTKGISALSPNDRVVLYYGSDVSCVAPTADETAPSVTASPSRTDTLPLSIAYQLDVGTRGNYTLCYNVAISSVPGEYVSVWGYDVVVVAPNPQNMTLYPLRESKIYRPNELLTYVFAGWGLAATTEKMDSVKLIQASAGSSTTDAMCQKNPAAQEITYYSLNANGTNAEQVWRVSPAGMNILYSVCYKLYGGQYHVIGEALTITGTASPSGATSAKLSGSSGTISSGESMSWTLVGVDAQSCAHDEALLFFSVNDCYDVSYYVDVTSIMSSSALMEITFPAGASVVSNCNGVTELRVPWTYVLDEGLPSAPESAPTASLSLCYWSTGNEAVSVLLSNAITLSEGVPPPLSITLSVTAHEVFSFKLFVSPTTTDWVVLVSNPENCVGVSAPANDAVFTDLTYSATTGMATVTAAVPVAGMYYVCYSHQTGICAPSTGRECARVVAQVEATAASPQSWSGQPTPVYVSSLFVIKLAFGSNGDAAAQGTTASAWLTAMATGELPLTMRDVWVACAQSQITASLRYGLTYHNANDSWTTDEILMRSGPYALCYTAQSTAGAPLHLFSPVSNAGPVVLASTVTGVNLPPLMTVANVNTVVLTGGGLSTTDVVIAVGLPSSNAPALAFDATEVPSDICTNEAYTPRVISTNPTSEKTTGMISMLRNLVFTTAGDYVLCYTATYGLTTSDSEPSTDTESVTGTTVLITPTAFIVSPSVISMTVTSSVLEVGVELDILFTGSGLTLSDMAALVYVGSIEGSATVQTVCLGSSVAYKTMVSVSADGTNAKYSTIPTEKGVHMACFRKSLSSTPILFPTKLSIGVRTAVKANFTVQPGGCTALLVCTVQPTITLLDTSNLATSAPQSSVSMQLYLTDGTTPAPAGYLSGSTEYSHVDFTNFTFWALRVSTEGSYIMKATVTLPGGDTLMATSSVVKVSKGSGAVADVAEVSCLPIGILDRTIGSTKDTVDCLITALTSDALSGFKVLVNVGTASVVNQNGTTIDGLPTYNFLVTAPSEESLETGLVNSISILVTPTPPHETLPVRNSPVTVRLATSPSSLTTIGCSAETGQLPLPNMVRVGGNVTCYVQGIAKIQGQAHNIVARPEDLKVNYYYNGVESTSAVVSLGPYPLDINGRYDFSLKPVSSLTISVAGTVFSTDGASTSSSGAKSTWVAMANSPQTFNLIGVPTATASRLMCASTRTGSMTWYTPTEPLQCTATLADARGPVNGLQSEYSLRLPDGGSVSEFNNSAWGVSLVWKLAAPPPPSSSVNSMKSVMPQQQPYAVRPVVYTLAAAVRQSFRVEVMYSTSITAIATYTGDLVYVASVVKTVPKLTQGKTVSITFAGLGLVTTHRYTLGDASNCSSVLSEARPTEGSAEGQLVLTFEVPNAAFTICFAPPDAPTGLQPLLAMQWTPETTGGPSHGWTGDDLVLLIVGVLVLFILLVLLIILLWCIFCAREEDSPDNIVDEEHLITHHASAGMATITPRAGGTGQKVYMPPRANNRYVLRSANESLPAAWSSPAPLPAVTSSAPPPPSTPAAPQQQQHPQYNPSSNTQIRINIHDSDGADLAAPRAPHLQAITPAAATSMTYSSSGSSFLPPATRRKRHHQRSHRSSSANSDYPPHQEHQSKSKYADLDSTAPQPPQPSDSISLTGTSAPEARKSVPPLPPPPLPSVTLLGHTETTPSAASGLVDSPRHAATNATAGTMQNKFPPPMPTTLPASSAAAQSPPSGSHEHMHHTASGIGVGSLGPCRSDNGAMEVLEPIIVAGHTSKPMVRSASLPR